MGALIKHRNDELEQFKSRINLVEYAQTQGYQVDRKESSENSKVLRHDNGDKIVVVTGQNGHGIYLSVRDDRDSGSIIDFVQKRTGTSLGQIRKALRPWINGIGLPPQYPRQPEPKPVPTSKDRQQMIFAYAKTEAEIVIATDNDPGGRRLAEELKKIVPAHGRSSRSVPARKDWNDDLQYLPDRVRFPPTKF